MSHEEGSSLNMFKFDEGLKVTVNTNSITMVEAEEAATHILRDIYVLELENQPNAWIVHKISGETINFGHYELEGTAERRSYSRKIYWIFDYTYAIHFQYQATPIYEEI
jgi:hypothetical protein